MGSTCSRADFRTIRILHRFYCKVAFFQRLADNKVRRNWATNTAKPSTESRSNFLPRSATRGRSSSSSTDGSCRSSAVWSRFRKAVFLFPTCRHWSHRQGIDPQFANCSNGSLSLPPLFHGASSAFRPLTAAKTEI